MPDIIVESGNVKYEILVGGDNPDLVTLVQRVADAERAGFSQRSVTDILDAAEVFPKDLATSRIKCVGEQDSAGRDIYDFACMRLDHVLRHVGEDQAEAAMDQEERADVAVDIMSRAIMGDVDAEQQKARLEQVIGAEVMLGIDIINREWRLLGYDHQEWQIIRDGSDRNLEAFMDSVREAYAHRFGLGSPQGVAPFIEEFRSKIQELSIDSDVLLEARIKPSDSRRASNLSEFVDRMAKRAVHRYITDSRSGRIGAEIQPAPQEVGEIRQLMDQISEISRPFAEETHASLTRMLAREFDEHRFYAAEGDERFDAFIQRLERALASVPPDVLAEQQVNGQRIDTFLNDMIAPRLNALQDPDSDDAYHSFVDVEIQHLEQVSALVANAVTTASRREPSVVVDDPDAVRGDGRGPQGPDAGAGDGGPGSGGVRM